ncbi:MAG: hypothetical protein SFU99_11385, partial [Saprospiraceae bacterium]|nr:hypothetical protein [Saprospiraceae bacterium]
MISLDKNEVNKSNIFQAKNLEFYKHRNVIKGKNNTVNINPDKVNIKKMNLKIIGSNNQIIIKDNCKLNIESIHLVGDNHILEIGSECRLTGKIAIKGEKNFIKIGNKTSFQTAYLLADESKSITIGEDCMFSSEV